MVESFKEKLIDTLINGKLLKDKDLARALDIQKKAGGSLGRILVENGFVSEKELMVAMSRQLNIPPINLSKCKRDKTLAELIPEKTAKQYLVIPVSRIGKVLTVAMSDPLNLFAIDDIKVLTLPGKSELRPSPGHTSSRFRASSPASGEISSSRFSKKNWPACLRWIWPTF